MNNKLFIGSLAFSTTDEELQEAFAAFGKVVSARVITDRDTGRSKGFGFVEFETEEEAKAAIDGMDGKELSGRTINVSIARPQEKRERRSFDGPRDGGGGGNRSW